MMQWYGQLPCATLYQHSKAAVVPLQWHYVQNVISWGWPANTHEYSLPDLHRTDNIKLRPTQVRFELVLYSECSQT